jgi:hypothetical protein
MARTKGSQNKDMMIRPATSELTVEERIQLLANLIVDRVADDQTKKYKLLQQTKRETKAICSMT